jgi:hypothetical protein
VAPAPEIVPAAQAGEEGAIVAAPRIRAAPNAAPSVFNMLFS